MSEILHKNVDILDGDLSDYFEVSDKLLNMYKIKLDAIEGISAHNPRIELQIDIIENEIIRILEKNSDNWTREEKVVLNYARVFYSKLFKIMDLVAISCKLYDNKVLAKKYFLPRIVEEIVLYKKEVRNVAYDYYKRFMNDEELNNKEQILMFEYFTSNIGTLSEKLYNAQQNIIKKLLDRKENYHIAGKIFYLKFINHEKCSRLGLADAKVYIGDNDFWGRGIVNKRLGGYYGGRDLIIIQESFVKNNPRDILKYSQTSYDMKIAHTMKHEIQHYEQDYCARSGNVNKTAMLAIKNNLFRKYLATLEFDEYHINWKYRETEREANIEAWRDVTLFFKKYASKNRFRDIQMSVNNYVKLSLEQAYSYQRNNSDNVGGTQVLEKYNIQNLRNIIAEHPQELKNYSQLSLFFCDNGKMKNLTTLIKEYTKKILDRELSYIEHKNYEDVYQEFFDYYFMVIDFENFTLDYLTIDEQMEFFVLVGMAYERELRKIKEMIEVYSNEKKVYFKVIARQRINRINKYYDYLATHQDIIASLDKQANISDLGLLTLDSLNKHLISLKSVVDDFSMELKTMGLENEMRLLVARMGDDDSGRKNGTRRT